MKNKSKIINHLKSYSIIEILLLIASVVFLVIDFVTYGGYFGYVKDGLGYLKDFLKWDNGIANIAWIPPIYSYIILHISIILLIVSLLIAKSKKRLIMIILNFLFSSTEIPVAIFLGFLSVILYDSLLEVL